MIGLGYYDTITPPVIRRNVLENPAWYTAYTPYQPEICQGRLEALLNFQTMVADLTGLPIANASLLDEATAAAEAMALAHRVGRRSGDTFVVDADASRRRIDVVRTRAEPLGIEVVVADLAEPLPDGDVLRRARAVPGRVRRGARPRADRRGRARARRAASSSPPTCSRSRCSTPPGEIGADVAVGTTQRFGVPLGFGGPHAGYLAVRDGPRAQLPGRLVGVSVDADGAPALPARAADARAAHPPREGDEQHLHRAGAARGDRRRCTPSTTARTGCARSPRACTGSPRSSPRACATAASTVVHEHVLRHAHRRACPGARPRSSRPRPATAASTCASSTPTRVGIALDETTTPRHVDGGAGARSASTADVDVDAPTADADARRAARTSRVPHPPGVLTRTAPRPRCCATCAGSPTATSRSTAR